MSHPVKEGGMIMYIICNSCTMLILEELCRPPEQQ